MRSHALDTANPLEGQLLNEVFQCEELLAREEDALLADLRYYQRVVHRHGLPSELKRLYRQQICAIEMLMAGMTDCLVSEPGDTPAFGH